MERIIIVIFSIVLAMIRILLSNYQTCKRGINNEKHEIS